MASFFNLIFSFILAIGNQNRMLDGTYKVDCKYHNYNGNINFSENKFKWKPYNILPFDGEIEYSTNFIYLKNSSNLLYKISSQNIQQDTIPFYIYDLNGQGNFLDVAVGDGNFIKIK